MEPVGRSAAAAGRHRDVLPQHEADARQVADGERHDDQHDAHDRLLLPLAGGQLPAALLLERGQIVVRLPAEGVAAPAERCALDGGGGAASELLGAGLLVAAPPDLADSARVCVCARVGIKAKVVE